jgi:anaerobic ribonucleoside-triphosphate reductase activating protein
MHDLSLRVANFIPVSHANGPGTRSVVWVQGCRLACPGCFNPQTHPFLGGTLVKVGDLIHQILSLGSSIEGITLSGGEPFHQAKALLELLTPLRQNNLSILIFTGFSLQELEGIPHAEDVLQLTDILIAGRYIESQRLASGLIGSRNKKVHFITGRYSPAALAAVPEAEIIISPSGDMDITGINPLIW